MALSRKSSSAAKTSSKKMFGDLPPSSVVEGIRFSAAYSMIRRPVVGLAGERDLVDPLARGEGHPDLGARADDDVDTPAGTMPSMISANLRIDHGVGLAGLRTDDVAAGEGRGELPGRHQDREVERHDLTDDAERLAEVVGDGVLVELGDRALFARA